jgi:hypothetical protein
MDRRQFLIGVAAALAVDPERLLWTPGQKAIFLPPPPRMPTLMEYAMTHKPDQRLQDIVALFNRSNDMLDDLVWIPSKTYRTEWTWKKS